jgi:sugar phosphate isomerase/epimerase
LEANTMPSQIACQMYTLRDFTKTPADIAQTLKRVKRIGYEAIQVSAFGPVDPAELAKMLKGEGLTCCATHVGMDRMRDQTQAVIEEHRMWGCQYTAIGGFFPKQATMQTWLDFAEQYNQVARRFEGSGITVGYHNHSHELSHFDGKPALRILIEKLIPQVWIEIDTYWITHGGGDPAAWIGNVKGRIPCVHLKDMGINMDRQQFMAEVGEGNLNWPAILKACR